MFAFIGVVLAMVQGVLVGRVVKRHRRATTDPSRDLGDRARHRPDSVRRGTCRRCSVALGVLAVGMGFNNPSLTSMVSRLADPNDQGGILGLASSLASLGRVVGPAWGGYLYDAYGMTHAVPERRGAHADRVRRFVVGLRD